LGIAQSIPVRGARMNVEKAQKRILVVDDEDHIRRILVRALMAEGYDVSDASNGADAITKVIDSTFDILISDVRMPGMNGLEAVRAIKSKRPEVIAVITSGVADEETAQAEAIAAGASAYFTKPYSLDELLTTLEEILLGE